jgi:hypothetical protein
MIDLRMWRATLLGAPLVAILAMFSLQEVPGPRQPSLPPDAFDATAATALTREVAEAHPEPRPGSDQDTSLAALVQNRFAAIPSVTVSEQRFDASFAGEDVELRNLIAVLPGQSERQVALIAHRDAADGSGAASSTAATAVMLELASALSGTTHEKTLVFVSTDGGDIGALGARRFAEGYSDADLLDAVVVLSQPASPDPAAPMVVPWSTGVGTTGIQLERTANAIVSEQVGSPAGDIGPLAEVFRLALPAALGEQGPLMQAGLDSVRLSSAGERPLPPSRDTVDGIDRETVERFGRSALSLLLALVDSPGELEQGPGTYIGFAGNLLPGWTLSLLAISLLLPVLAAAGAGLARAAGAPGEAARALGWAGLRVVPFAVALLLLYFFSLVGLIADPRFPFDPASEELGLEGTIATTLAVLAFAAAASLLRPLLPPPAALSATAPGVALLLAAVGGLAVWAVNPYLGLLAAVGLQAWVLAAATDRGRLAAAGLVAAGLIPALALVVDLAARFGAGTGVVGDLVLMFSDDQLGDLVVLLACVIGGAALAIIASRGPASPPDAPQLKLRALVARGRELERRRSPRRSRGPLGRRGERRRLRDRERRERAERLRGELEQGVPPDGEQASEPGPSEEAPPEGEGPEGEPAASDPDRPPEAEPAADQGEPERDPRIWSKPGAAISAPSRSRMTAPAPPLTSPT